MAPDATTPGSASDDDSFPEGPIRKTTLPCSYTTSPPLSSIGAALSTFGFTAGLAAAGGLGAEVTGVAGIDGSSRRGGTVRASGPTRAAACASSDVIGTWAGARLTAKVQPTRPTIQPRNTARARTAAVRAPVR